MLERMKLLAEGRRRRRARGRAQDQGRAEGQDVVVLVVSGGNIDINLLDRIIGHGLAKMGRLFRFAVDMHDRPAELGKLLSEIAATGANVHTIEHDRTRRDVPIGGARVMLELETRGAGSHSAERSHLRRGLHSRRVAVPRPLLQRERPARFCDRAECLSEHRRRGPWASPSCPPASSNPPAPELLLECFRLGGLLRFERRRSFTLALASSARARARRRS